jgi:large subunit ribosomal protein L25
MLVTVECNKREEGTKPKALRRNNLIPANLYGHNGAESISLTIDAKTAQNLLKQAAVNNTLIDLSIPDLSWKGKTILREVQTHPWKNSIYHISFFAVAAQATIDLVVPVNYVGEPAGAKEGGVLECVINELPIQCAPDNIPEAIDVDVSGLELGGSLHVGELVLPEGVVAQIEPERTLANILVPRGMGKAEEEEEAGAELDPTTAALLESYGEE